MADQVEFELMPKDESKLQKALEGAYAQLDKIASKAADAAKKIGDLFSGEKATKGVGKIAAAWDKVLGKLAMVAAKQAQIINDFPDMPGVGWAQATPVGSGRDAFASTGVGRVAGSIGAGVSAGVGGIGAIGGGAMDAFGAVTGVFTQMTSQVGKFVEAANPAATMNLDFAFQDLYATLGEKLTPLINVATEIVGRFADTISTLNFDGLDKILQSLGDAFNSIMEAIMPLVQVLIDILVPVFKFLADGIAEFARWIKIAFGWLFGEQKKGQKSQAAGNINVGSIESVSSRALVAAGRVGGAGGRNYQEEIANNTASTARGVNRDPDRQIENLDTARGGR